jgi:hypothetical protein
MITGELLTPRHFKGIPSYDVDFTMPAHVPLAEVLEPAPTKSFTYREGVRVRS